LMSRDGGSIGAIAIVSILVIAAVAGAQTAGSAGLRRVAGGKPDFNGVWQALNTASWNLEDHTGALGMPPGQSVVEGGEIPYQPAALARRQENFAKRATADPTEANCFAPGVPRANYMPYPFSIVQTPKTIAIVYEFGHHVRQILMDGSKHPEGNPDTWMGDSRGRWEGDTLVVDVTGFNDQTWFDHAGNYHSDALHVVERYIPQGPDHILYEATIEDPKVFTRSWKISMPLYRRVEKNVKVLEYECVFYLQEERFKDAPFKQ
ncbi:MAG TPA: hypothetical protein VFY29_04620, partial [Terriglobia bacterium]|nr:hypothetical protein [Terriglobia bacterium]